MRCLQFAAAIGCASSAFAFAPPVAPSPEPKPAPPAAPRGEPEAPRGASAPANNAPNQAHSAAPTGFAQDVPGTAIVFDMVNVPGSDAVKPFSMSRTEVSWELYDVFVYQLDNGSAPPETGADAVARPTKPYISMDRGFGHAGWPAISMSAHNAKHFCEWLSKKTGRTYRLPTLAEWKHAAARAQIPSDQVAEFAWVRENADAATHKLGTRKADAGGLHDLFGNAAEWVVDDKGDALVIGGSFRDAASVAGPDRLQPDNEDWNASDPQFPKSVWWLADGGFIGLRLVCESSPSEPTAPPKSNEPTHTPAP